MPEDEFTVKGVGDIFVELSESVVTRSKGGVPARKVVPRAMKRVATKKVATATKKERVKKSLRQPAVKAMKAMTLASKVIKTVARAMGVKAPMEDRQAKCRKAQLIAETLRDYVIEQVDNQKIRMKRNTPFKKLVLDDSSGPYAGSDFWDFLKIERKLNCTYVLYWSDQDFRKTTPQTIVKMFDGSGYVVSPTDSAETKRRARWFWTNVFKKIPATTVAQRKKVFQKIKNKDGKSGRFITAKRRFFSGPVKKFARKYAKDNSVSIFYDETTQRVIISVK